MTIDAEKKISAVNEVLELIGNDNAMAGSAVDAVDAVVANESTIKEISI